MPFVNQIIFRRVSGSKSTNEKIKISKLRKDYKNFYLISEPSLSSRSNHHLSLSILLLL